MKNNIKGQATILIIFVIGMVGLLIGMTLSKTGFAESMMGRGIAGSTYAFYVANAGVEDAFYKIQKADEDEDYVITPYELVVGEGAASITVTGDSEQREITSVGKYENYVRKIQVSAYNTTIRPEFARIIQAGTGGVEINNNVRIVGRDKVTGVEFPVNIYSNSFIRGKKNGNDGQPNCDNPAATTQINGNAYAVTVIEGLNGGEGPCIDGDAYAGSLKECRIYGSAYSGDENYFEIEDECPHDPENICDPDDEPERCVTPEKIPLPDIEPELIYEFLEDYGVLYDGNCEIGESTSPCWLKTDGTPTIGNIIIDGNLSSSIPEFYISGPVFVKGDVEFASNQTISLDPSVTEETSLIILTRGEITSSSNVTFTSDGSSFLLLASEKEDNSIDMCDDSDGNAITVSANVAGILFYAINGCALVKTSASEEYYGAIIGQAVKLENNVQMAYDSDLEDAEFYLRREGGWQISSFTEL